MKTSPSSTLRIYLRRSKDDGQQAFSLDVQREGCRQFVTRDMPTRWGLSPDWGGRVEYVDDGIAGDDFVGLAALKRLRAEAQRGDVIVVRDLSRLGRDALEPALVIRDLARERNVRIFYYDSREEVSVKDPMDIVMTVIKGAAAEAELHAIRSRTREALRRRVESGFVAGGRTYGYDNVRQRNADGSEYTTAVVNPEQAEVVRRIFREFIQGKGLKKIAIGLNNDGIPPPTAGRRGTGSWAPTCIHAMLRNERYRGVYVHGRVKRVKRGGKKVLAERDPNVPILRREIPEWRIIDDVTWQAVQGLIRHRQTSVIRQPTRVRYALTSIARCGTCGGAIGVARTKRTGGQRVPAYACQYHHERGAAVCPVTIHQPVEDVERALVRFLQEKVFTQAVLDRILAEIRAELDRLAASAPRDRDRLKKELDGLQKQRGNLIRLAAHAGDGASIPELAAQLTNLKERAARLEAELATAQRAEISTEEALARIEAAARATLADLERTVAADDREGLREVFRALFPGGLIFTPVENRNRRVWAISGRARLGGSRLRCDPTGTPWPMPRNLRRPAAGVPFPSKHVEWRPSACPSPVTISLRDHKSRARGSLYSQAPSRSQASCSDSSFGLVPARANQRPSRFLHFTSMSLFLRRTLGRPADLRSQLWRPSPRRLSRLRIGQAGPMSARRS
ncbi:MAG: recombinase family protein [Deltaproteobacteria bacterium]|nr:recombinase family protein [Deltaproteobacteria bacterium]